MQVSFLVQQRLTCVANNINSPHPVLFTQRVVERVQIIQECGHLMNGRLMSNR